MEKAMQNLGRTLALIPENAINQEGWKMEDKMDMRPLPHRPGKEPQGHWGTGEAAALSSPLMETEAPEGELRQSTGATHVPFLWKVSRYPLKEARRLP